MNTIPTQATHPEENQRPIFYLIWIVIFGVILGIGGSLLENVQVNPLAKVFLSGPFVILVLTLNKLVLQRRFSVTHMYIIASTIAIFTNYLGPPNPLKPIFILAGLAFDTGTFFKTKDIRYRDLISGHLAAGIVGFLLSFLMTALLSWELAKGFINVFLLVGGIYTAMIFPVTAIAFRTISAGEPPEIVRRIRSTLDE